MATCLITFSAVDPQLATLPGAKLVFTPYPDVIRGAGGQIMTPNSHSATADGSGSGSIALAPGQYQLTMTATRGARTAQITVPDAETALLGDLVDATFGDWEFSELQALRAETRAWAENAENVPVLPGLFSAKHWMAKAMAWATGTLPGGAGTKSSREFAEDSANSATSALNSANNASMYDPTRRFATVALLLASTRAAGGAGTIWQAEGFLYREAASGASDQHITTAGGVKLYVLRQVGVFPLDAFGDPSLPATWTAALTAANGDPIAVHSDHTLTGAVSYSGPVCIYGNGHTVSMGTAGSLDFTATLTSLPNLASNIARHANVVTFASAHGLIEGDVFCVWNPTSFSWSSHRDYYRDGDWMRVAEVVSATQVKIYGHSPDTYASSAMQCYKMNGRGVELRRVRFVPRTSGAFITIDGHQNVVVDTLSCPAGNAERNFLISRCYDVKIENVRSTSLKAGGAQNAYPVAISNCKKVRATGSGQYSDRHVLAFGGGTSAGSVPTRDVIISGMHMVNLDTGVGAADAHGNVDDITFMGCIIDTGMNVGGRNVRAIGCKVRGRTSSSDGLCVYADEVVGGLYQFTSCEFETIGDGASFGIIDFAPYSLNGTILQQLREAWTLRLDGCTIRNLGSSSSTMRCVRVFVGNSADGAITQWPIDIIINNLDVDSPSALVLLAIAGTNNVSSNLRIAINDGLIAPSCSLVSVTNTANNAAAMRLPRQVVREDVSYDTTVSSVSMATGKAFPWAYPKVPMVTASFQRKDATAYNPGTSNLVTASVLQKTATTARVQIKSTNGSAFTIAGTGEFVADAWIRDF